jgi:GTPase SAR1 family protein
MSGVQSIYQWQSLVSDVLEKVLSFDNLFKATLRIRMYHFEDEWRKQVELDGRQYMLNSIEHHDSEETEPQMKELLSIDAFLICFSITNTRGLEDMEKWYKMVCSVKEAPIGVVPVVFVGCKGDMEEERCISDFEVMQFAKSKGVPYILTSARARIGVDDAFYKMIREYLSGNWEGLHPEQWRELESGKVLFGEQLKKSESGKNKCCMM